MAAGNKIVRGAQLASRVAAGVSSAADSVAAANAATAGSSEGQTAAGGDLDGNLPNPGVVAIHETTTGVQTRLAVASVPAGTVLQRNGSSQLVGLPVANAQLAAAAANTLKGNNTGGVALPVDMTVAQALTLLGLSGGLSATVALAKITAIGTDGSLTFTNGVLTSKVDPT